MQRPWALDRALPHRGEAGEDGGWSTQRPGTTGFPVRTSLETERLVQQAGWPWPGAVAPPAGRQSVETELQGRGGTTGTSPKCRAWADQG